MPLHQRRSRISRLLLIYGAACALCCAATCAQAQMASTDDRWHYAITPYLWLPTVNGKLAFDTPAGNANPTLEVGPYNWLEHMNGVAMLSGEASKGRWSLLGDLIYIDFADQRGAVKQVDFRTGPGGRVAVAGDANLDASVDLHAWLVSFAGAYRVLENQWHWMDVYGGLRYLQVSASADWRLNGAVTLAGSGTSFAANGNVSQSAQITTAIVGVRGRLRLGAGNWYLPYSLDVGGGSSTFTWQATAGVGYAYRWGDLLLSYRYLAYDMNEGKLLQNVSFGGPALSATFRF